MILPHNIQFVYTTWTRPRRSGQIYIEGGGVQPTIRVPITAENVLSRADPLMAAAVAYLDSLPCLRRTRIRAARTQLPPELRRAAGVTIALGVRSGGVRRA